MNSRKLVLQTLDGDTPQRIPRHMWTLPWAEIHYPGAIEQIQKEFPNDIVYTPRALYKEPKVTGDFFSKGKYIDEWGCEFFNLDDGIIGEVKNPLIKTADDIGSIRIPAELLEINKEEVNSFCKSTDAFVIGDALPRPFERLQWLRGTEQLYIDFLLEPELVERMLKIVHDFYMKQLEAWCDTDIDGIWFMDDWGTQSTLLVSLDIWKQFFLPCYKDYIELAKSKGKRTFFHSDGHTFAVIEPLIQAGLDAVNTQIFCMDIEELGKQYKGRITFWGEIDRQHLLPEGTKEEIHRAVHKVFTHLYDRGRVIAQCEFGPSAKPENVYEVFNAWNNYP